MFCSREYQPTSRLNQQIEKPTSNCNVNIKGNYVIPVDYNIYNIVLAPNTLQLYHKAQGFLVTLFEYYAYTEYKEILFGYYRIVLILRPPRSSL